MGLGLIGLLVVSLAATLELDGTSGTVFGVDEDGRGSDKISFSSPKYTPSGLGASSEEATVPSVISPSISLETDD